MSQRIGLSLRTCFYFGMETQRFVAQTSLDNFFQTNEGPAANEQNVRRINREEFLMRMFSSTLRRHICDRAFKNLQQRLLDAFTGNIAGYRRILVLAANLIDLIDVDDPLLSAFDISVGSLQEFENDVLDIFTDIAGFREGGGIDDRERHTQHACECLREQSLTCTGRPDQNNI